MTSSLVVSGSIAYDYISRYDRPFQEVLLPDQLHRLSVCFVVSEKERFFGGTAGNICYNLSLLGQRSRLLAGVGYDFEEYRKRLKKLGVDLSALRPSSDVATASATIITDSNGHQIAEFYPGAMGGGLKPHTNGLENAPLMIIAPDATEWMMEYVRLCQELNVPYFFDPGQGLPGFTAGQLIEAVERAEGVFLNDYEFELLKSITQLNEDELFDRTGLLIVTYGDRGSRIFTRSEILDIPAVPPKESMDPTGCGDAYRAAFLTGYLEDRDLETCGRMGALMATYCVEHDGTQQHGLNWKKFSKRYAKAFEADL